MPDYTAKNSQGRTAAQQRLMNLKEAKDLAQEIARMVQVLIDLKHPSTLPDFNWGHAGDAGHLAEVVAEAYDVVTELVSASRTRR